MKIGFIRPAPGYPVKEQRAALQAYGCKKIVDDRDELFRAALRRGAKDELVVQSLHLLGTSRKDLHVRLLEAAKHGVTIVDLSYPNLRASAETAAWITEALRRSTGEAIQISKEDAAKGGRKRKGHRKERELSRAELHAIWFSKEHLTNDDAAIAAGVPKRSLYRLFGSSGRPAGWPGRRNKE